MLFLLADNLVMTLTYVPQYKNKKPLLRMRCVQLCGLHLQCASIHLHSVFWNCAFVFLNGIVLY